MGWSTAAAAETFGPPRAILLPVSRAACVTARLTGGAALDEGPVAATRAMSGVEACMKALLTSLPRNPAA